MLIYLVRHGETDWNLAGRIQGQEDNDLNETGREQARLTAKKLSGVTFDAAFCSTLIRAVHTAQIILGEQPVPLTQDARIREIGFGRYEGEMIEEIQRNEQNPLHNFFAHPEGYIPPETAESYQELYRRSGEFVKEVLCPAQDKWQNVLVVGHGAWNRSILNPLMGIALKDFESWPLENCAVRIIELKDGKMHLLDKQPM